MKTKLNGWQRLWILCSALGLAASGAIALYTQPSIQDVKHNARFYEALSPQHQSMLVFSESAASPEGRETIEFRGEMPNGHFLVFRRGVTEDQSLSVAREYDLQLTNELSQRQFKHFGMAFGIWVGASIIVYVLGWAIGWVIRGFSLIDGDRF